MQAGVPWHLPTWAREGRLCSPHYHLACQIFRPAAIPALLDGNQLNRVKKSPFSFPPHHTPEGVFQKSHFLKSIRSKKPLPTEGFLCNFSFFLVIWPKKIWDTCSDQPPSFVRFAMMKSVQFSPLILWYIWGLNFWFFFWEKHSTGKTDQSWADLNMCLKFFWAKSLKKWEITKKSFCRKGLFLTLWIL